jgi:hypothetical protein
MLHLLTFKKNWQKEKKKYEDNIMQERKKKLMIIGTAYIIN